MNFESIVEKLISLFNLTDEYSYYRIGILAALALCLIFFVVYSDKTRVISSSIRNAIERHVANSLSGNQQKKTKRRDEDSLIYKIESRFTYSGIKHYFHFMTSGLYIMFAVATAVAFYALTNLVTKSVVPSLIAAMSALLIYFFVEQFMASRNLQRTDDNLLEFANMLSGYSSNNSELSDIFARIANHVDDPIKTAIEEYVYEAGAYGTDIALESLCEKIEHPKFKELIKNIKMAYKYSASFKTVVDNNRNVISDYMIAKKQRKSMVTENMASLAISCLMFVVVITLTGRLFNENIWVLLATTGFGQMALFLAIACISFFFLEMYLSNK